MASKSYSYTHEKLSNAFYSLATGGKIADRLVSAYIAFHTLTEKDFPKELREDWQEIIKALTKYPPYKNYEGKITRGSVQMTAERIRTKTGVKIAKKIADLYYKISDLVR